MERIGESLEGFTQQANQTLAVTQQLKKHEDALNWILAAMDRGGHDFATIDMHCLLRSQQLPTKAERIAERDSLKNQIADLEGENLDRKTANTDLDKDITKKQEESQSTADLCEEVKQDFERATKQIEAIKITLEAKKNLLTTATENYDEKNARYDALDTKLRTIEDTIDNMKKDRNANSTEYRAVDTGLKNAKNNLHGDKERYIELHHKIDQQVTELNKRNCALYTSFQEI